MEIFPPHIVQSTQWGKFKTKMGTPSVRINEVQFTLHKIPFIPYFVGYCPKVNPKNINWEQLYEAGKKHNCTHVKIDVPNTKNNYKPQTTNYKLISSEPTFATNTFLIDLTKSEDTLLNNMHHKTRYNIRLAQRKGVKVSERNDKEAINIFIQLQKETAKSQKFYIHPDNYYKTLWNMFQPQKLAHILVATYNGGPLVAYFLLRYKETLYYTYGGSSLRHKNVMASNLIMWESIRSGKNIGCKIFDMWGALGENPDPTDSWYGFHRFKSGYGGKLNSFPRAWDLVIKPIPYKIFKLADKYRWIFLGLKK